MWSEWLRSEIRNSASGPTGTTGWCSTGGLRQNSLGKGSAMGLGQAHSWATMRLGLADVEAEGRQSCSEQVSPLTSNISFLSSFILQGHCKHRKKVHITSGRSKFENFSFVPKDIDSGFCWESLLGTAFITFPQLARAQFVPTTPSAWTSF